MIRHRIIIFISAAILVVLLIARYLFCFDATLYTSSVDDSPLMQSISFYNGAAKGIMLSKTTLDNVFNLYVPGCGRDELYLSCPCYMRIEVNEQVVLKNGDEVIKYVTEISDEGIPYIAVRIISIGGREIFSGYINFFYTARIPSVFISVPKADMVEINSENPETNSKKMHTNGILTVVNEKGELDVEADVDLSRRGNTSFLHMHAKPYNLNLSEPISMLGMDSGRKFALKANSYDLNHILRNEAAFDLARVTEMSCIFDSRFADVYINGEYYGIYLISNRIKGDELLQLGSKGYLMELDYRYEKEKNSFVSHDQGIVVHYPESLTEEEMSYVQDKYEKAYDAIASDGAYEEYIDVDSFIKMYLIQDFFCNVDVDYASFYFYLGEDGLFHAGPCWDFDLATGIMQTLPFHEELAKRSHIIPDRGGIFLSLLDKSPGFRTRVREYYLNEFHPIIIDYACGELLSKGQKIKDSLKTSEIKNGVHFNGFHSLDSAEGLSEWMLERGNILKSYYEAPEEYVQVVFHFAWGEIRTISKRGESLGYLPDNNHPDNDDTFWGEVTGFCTEDGEKVEDCFSPKSDIDLFAIYSKDSHALEEGYVNIAEPANY